MQTTRPTARFGELAADEWGAPDHRPTLVLMHGLTFDRQMWHATVAVLQVIDPGRHVLAVDLPGHGESAASINPRLGDGGRAIADGLQLRGIVAPVLVGHSAAAVDATFCSAEYPVSGIVNVDTPLRVEGFATVLRQLAARYDRDYPAMWHDVLLPSLRIAQLPEPAQRLLAAHSTPTRDVLAAGWDEVLDRPVAELASGCSRRSPDCGSRQRRTSLCSATNRHPAISPGWPRISPRPASRSGLGTRTSRSSPIRSGSPVCSPRLPTGRPRHRTRRSTHQGKERSSLTDDISVRLPRK